MQETKSLLITRPEHDLITKYFCIWSEYVIAVAHEKRLTLYDLRGKKASRKEVDSYVCNKKPSIIFFNGHGNESEIAGHDNEIISDKATTPKEAIIYVRSCDAGQKLGGTLVNSGARAFIGYKRKFFLGYSPDKVMHPEKDMIAELFLAPSNLAVTTLLKKNTAQEAHRRSRDAMYKNMRKMLSSKGSFEERHAAKWLWSNLNSQVLIGDPKASL